MYILNFYNIFHIPVISGQKYSKYLNFIHDIWFLLTRNGIFKSHSRGEDHFKRENMEIWKMFTFETQEARRI